MKIVAKQLKTESTGVKTMPDDMRLKLKGLTINEALERGLITDLGDDTGKFIFNHGTIEDAAYAVVQGYAVRVSPGVKDAVDNLDNIVGDLRFMSDVSTIDGEGFGKPWFRLAMPAGINLGEAIHTLEPQTVANA